VCMHGRGSGRGDPKRQGRGYNPVQTTTEEEATVEDPDPPLLYQILGNRPAEPTTLVFKATIVRTMQVQHFMRPPTVCPLTILWKPSAYNTTNGAEGLKADLKADLEAIWKTQTERTTALELLVSEISLAPVAPNQTKSTGGLYQLHYKNNHLWVYRNQQKWHIVLYQQDDVNTFILVRIFGSKEEDTDLYKKFLCCWECGFAKTVAGKTFYK